MPGKKRGEYFFLINYQVGIGLGQSLHKRLHHGDVVGRWFLTYWVFRVDKLDGAGHFKCLRLIET